MYVTSLKHMQYSVNIKAVNATVSISKNMLLNNSKDNNIMTTP